MKKVVLVLSATDSISPPVADKAVLDPAPAAQADRLIQARYVDLRELQKAIDCYCMPVDRHGIPPYQGCRLRSSQRNPASHHRWSVKQKEPVALVQKARVVKECLTVGERKELRKSHC